MEESKQHNDPNQIIDWDKVSAQGKAAKETLGNYGVRTNPCVAEALQTMTQLHNAGIPVEDIQPMGSGLKKGVLSHAWVRVRDTDVDSPQNRTRYKNHYGQGKPLGGLKETWMSQQGINK